MGMAKFQAAVLLPLGVALALAGCGGSASTVMSERQAGSAVAIAQPAPAPAASPAPVTLATAEFSAMARDGVCADTRNRLFVIDGKQVFWDRAGNCADAAYAQTLYGSSPQALLCSAGDSIAGPQTSCTDASARALFDTIVTHLDQDDLGLGAGRKVEQVRFLPAAGTVLAWQSVVKENDSGVSARQNLVIKDATAWARLWAEHTGDQTPAPALPQVDFSRQMLVAVFAGEFPNACQRIGVRSVSAGTGKLKVEIDHRDISDIARCLPVVAHPVHIVAVDRVDAEVDFADIRTAEMAFTTLDESSQSGVTRPATLVIKDAAAWASLWAEHAGGERSLPQVDFQTSMVIAVFRGSQPSSCHGTGIVSVARLDDRISVLRADSQPGPATLCAALMTSPAHLVVVGRSDLPVEFATERTVSE
jgi:hypothetical protein